MRGCRVCDNATSGDCGGHGSVVISLPQVNVTLNQEGLAQMIARAVVALESIAASMRPTITVGHAEPPSVCAGSGQPAHGLPLDATACKVEFSLQYAFASRPLELVISPVFDRIANTFIDAFVKRAEQVHGPR